MSADNQTCGKRNIHGRKLKEINKGIIIIIFFFKENIEGIAWSLGLSLSSF